MSNKNFGIFAILAALAAWSGLRSKDFQYIHHSSAPEIPHKHHGGRPRAQVPNDGRWHMRHHRGRA